MSYKASPRDLTFGYEKLQPLGALINVGIIWFVTVELFIEATQRIFKQ
jgi:Co/Zn/Cd efflux system component